MILAAALALLLLVRLCLENGHGRSVCWAGVPPPRRVRRSQPIDQHMAIGQTDPDVQAAIWGLLGNVDPATRPAYDDHQGVLLILRWDLERRDRCHARAALAARPMPSNASRR